MFSIDLVIFLCKAVIIYVDEAYHRLRPRQKRTKSLTGQVVLVVGAGHGVGRELAMQFARLGAKVVCWDLNQEENGSTVDDIRTLGHSAYGYQCDVSQRAEVFKVATQVRQEIGNVSVIVNNATIKPSHPFLSHNVMEIQRNIAVNLLSHFWTIYEFLPHMLATKRGHIIAISSFSSNFLGVPNLVPYCASQSGVKGLMKSLRNEINAGNRKSGVKFTTVHLGAVQTKPPTNNVKKYKYPWLVRAVDSAAAARLVLDAVLQDKEVVYIPKVGHLFSTLWGLLPRKVQGMLYDLVGIDACAEAEH
jgi:NAD(P)-dependent dehydrogenase (short-subunit alcohol dehydrogenase family)